MTYGNAGVSIGVGKGPVGSYKGEQAMEKFRVIVNLDGIRHLDVIVSAKCAYFATGIVMQRLTALEHDKVSRIVVQKGTENV